LGTDIDLLLNTPDIAVRFRFARGLVKQNLKEFCEKHGFNRFTIESWETGKHGINLRILARFCEALNAEGVSCSPEWLMKGKGHAAVRIGLRDDLPFTHSSQVLSEETRLINAEVQLFQDNQIKIKRQPLVVQVNDEAMKPFYGKGDYLGGYVLPERSLDTLLGKICIVGLEKGHCVVRRIMKENTGYLLIPSDYSERALLIKEPKKIAKIVWHRTSS
jgi:transcriptional regulator with XRE-family HTH domain